ncbi:2OG-Fe(II) oxygenase [Microbulbifer guangxiensis]|uniref:2OG-Fe(II) oxygenase n=1 Tax=Microbulbifer guangxiensis TaxID=2904249 RepID=UPI001F2DBF0B|nr:2OG-Fe(II) oxygenase family protein [Microbulbifer guangxiensis]
MYHISKALDIERYRSAFSADGFVQVPDFLQGQSADALHALLMSQAEWNLAFNHGGKHVDLSYRDYSGWTEQQKATLAEVVWSQARAGFQYFYKTIPIYDIYTQNLLPGNELNMVYELVNSEAFLGAMRELVGDDSIAFADVQATSFESGHFLKEHDDNVPGKNRVAAYVLNLTRDWQPDWGGFFHIFNGEWQVDKSLVPTFNAINVFKVPRKHSVAYVSPFAGSSRLSITGWLRKGAPGS